MYVCMSRAAMTNPKFGQWGRLPGPPIAVSDTEIIH